MLSKIFGWLVFVFGVILVGMIYVQIFGLVLGDILLKDDFFWLEDIYGVKLMVWVKQQNVFIVVWFVIGEFFMQDCEWILEVFDLDEYIFYVNCMGKYLYNFWCDKMYLCGVW